LDSSYCSSRQLGGGWEVAWQEEEEAEEEEAEEEEARLSLLSKMHEAIAN